MRISTKSLGTLAAGVTLLATASFGQALTPELKAKLEVKTKQLEHWSSDPELVAAVKERNENLPADAKAMTQEKWQKLTVLDPFVRSFTKTPLAMSLKAKKDEAISECFVSGADGTKVAFLAKTTNWSHADKDKHRVPMTGKHWIGPLEVDESSGQQQVQVGLPVLDKGKPIGSIVFGVNVAKLR
jgi:hypothetical protein